MLGSPVPVGYHSISVSLPEWKHVVGYEEGHTQVVNAMTVGYPRFRFHNDVTILNYVLISLHHFKLSAHGISVVIDLPHSVGTDEQLVPLSSIKFSCTVVPNKWTGFRLAQYLTQGPDSCAITEVSVHTIGALKYSVVYFPVTSSAKAKSFWQHCGEVISSRLAVHILSYLQSDLLKGAVDFSWWTPPTETIDVAAEAGAEVSEARGLTSLSVYCGQLITLLVASLDVSLLRAAAVPGEVDRYSEPESRYSASRVEIISRIGAMVEESPRFLPSGAQQSDLASNIALTPCGMSAIYTALRLALLSHDRLIVEHRGRSTPEEVPIVVVFGFPYLDTLKMMRRSELNPGGCEFLGLGDDADLDRLEQLLQRGVVPAGDDTASGNIAGSVVVNRVAAIFTEFPSNPLMKCPDLPRLTQLARRFGSLLVVDDTIANFANADLLHKPEVQVDLLCSSLSKIFNGVGNAMAGSLVVNSLGSRAAQLTGLLAELQVRGDIAQLYEEDAVVVEFNSRNFLARSHATNRNAASLAQWLSQHAAVERIYYPGLTNTGGTSGEESNAAALAVFQAVGRANELRFAGSGGDEAHVPGRGCLLSLVLKPHYDTKAFYDALLVSKGPSLGTAFTLVCPYTLLAHYTELEWAAQYGVHADLIRVSVGVEPFEEIRLKFEVAIAASARQVL